MYRFAATALFLFAGCASLSDLGEGLSGAGAAVSKHARRVPTVDPISVSNIRPF